MKPNELVQKVTDVPIEAAHQVMAVSDLVWLFDPQRFRWNRPHLFVAAQHFNLPVTPEVSLNAHGYETSLLEQLLAHLCAAPSHQFVVLYRLGSNTQGWVCLIPSGEMATVEHILLGFHLQATPAPSRQVLM